MKKSIHCLMLSVLAALLISSAPADALEVQVSLAPRTRSYAPPPLGRRQGWLTVTNRDWKTYTLVQSGNDKLYLYDAAAHGGIAIPSGATVTMALERDTYDLYTVPIPNGSGCGSAKAGPPVSILNRSAMSVEPAYAPLSTMAIGSGTLSCSTSIPRR